MYNLTILAVALGLLGGAAALDLDWAYPKTTPTSAPASAVSARALAGSPLRFTEAQLHDRSHAVDWRPDAHPAAPRIVLQGRGPGEMACGYCHLANGQGRTENASLAGLPAAYIAAQVQDFRSGARRLPGDWHPGVLMVQAAQTVTDQDLTEASAYFASLRFTRRVRVVEDAAPPAMVADGFVYRPAPDGGRMTLGKRIVEAPEDFERFELRDPDLGYVAYAPPGSIGRGRALARTSLGVTAPACAQCHGPGLRGGLAPPLAGRSPTYLYRQLAAFRSGARAGAGAAPMQPIAARLSDADRIDLAAYIASLTP